MTIERFGKFWLMAATLVLAVPASPAFSQLAQKPNVTVYASPT
jgi:hypothetical protein